MSTLLQYIETLDALFAYDKIKSEDRRFLETIQADLKTLNQTAKHKLVDILLERNLPKDQFIALMFFLYDCFADVRFLERALPYLPEIMTPPEFNFLFWNIKQRLFTNTVSSEIIESYLRLQFGVCSKATKRFLIDRNMLPKFNKQDRPKRIAIISPQILNMSHSPTREAFSMSLNLTTYHDCECFIINTNSMSYKGDNPFNLLACAEFKENSSLVGAQQMFTEYMDLSGNVTIISFPAEPVSSQKIAQICHALVELGVDCIISHGENLMVMDVLYRSLPSLFATTGSVVPYAHCDAYFVPKDLLTDHTDSIAQKYDHSNFLIENMLVTPQGKAKEPVARNELGWAESDIVFIVVGTRLEHELTPDFIRVCNKLLVHSDSTRIVFLGTKKLNLENFFDEYAIEQKRVENLGFRHDFPELCLAADVYLNPDRVGGGTSAQTAIINGLPIVSLNKGHISAFLPQHFKHDSWDNYLGFAMDLLDNNLRIQKAEELLDFFVKNSDSKQQYSTIYAELTRIYESFY